MKNKKIYSLAILLLSITVLFIYSCSKNETASSEKEITTSEKEGKINTIQNTSQAFSSTYKVGNIWLSYKANITGSIITSSLEISDRLDKTSKRHVIDFSFDDQMPSYKLTLHEQVLLKAEELKDDFSASEIKEVAKVFEVFGKQIVGNEKADQVNKLTQSLFFHNAILKTIERTTGQEKDCNCTPHPGFFVDKLSFWCQEDYLISPAKFVQVIDKSKLTLTENQKKAYLYLKTQLNKPQISIDKFYNELEPKTSYMNRISSVYSRFTANNVKLQSALKQKSSNVNPKNTLSVMKEEDCLKGTDLGCCGSYSGCCWYSSMDCLIHDVECLTCDKWHCGPACKPSVPAIPS